MSTERQAAGEEVRAGSVAAEIETAVVVDYDSIVAEFPKPLTTMQRHDIKTQHSHLKMAEQKLRKAASLEENHIQDAEKSIEAATKEIKVLKGEIEAEQTVIRAPGTIATSKPNAAAAGAKRKRGDADDGKEAREEEESPAEAPKKDEKAAETVDEKADAADKPSSTEEKKETPATPAAAPAGRQRATIGKSSKMFASLQGFLKGAQKQNEKLNEATKTRRDIAVKSKVEEQERIIAQHKEVITKHQAGKKEIDDKVSTVSEQKEKYKAVVNSMESQELAYSQTFSLEAKGSLYNIYFRPAQHNEKSLKALADQLKQSSVKYLDFRGDVDPLLEEVEARRAENQRKKEEKRAAHVNTGVSEGGFVEDKTHIDVEGEKEEKESANLFF